MSSAILIASTKPVQAGYTAQDLITYMARVSNPKNQADLKTSDRLFKYLIRNKHWSPFEMVSLTIEIKTTRDISRQILRHRSFSFQEFSQRYAEVEDHHIITSREARLQDHKNRQNSIVPSEEEADPLNEEFSRLQEEVATLANRSYKRALELGLAKEVARALLPEGLTQTTMYMSGTLRSWIHYVLQREANGTQKEHMEIALKCKDILFDEFPALRDIWDELRRGEGEI